jgi:hypothetical protein
MIPRTRILIAVLCLSTVTVLAQSPVTADAPFQVRYTSNLDVGDSFINITNTGASSTVSFPTQNGNICVNVYAFSPDEQLVSCCSCVVTPDALVSLSARNDLASNTLTPGVPTSLVVKLISSAGATDAAGATTCSPSTTGTPSNLITTGMAAWGTTIHALPVTPGSPATTYGVTETAFTPAALALAAPIIIILQSRIGFAAAAIDPNGPELTRVRTLCGFIQTNGSGFGICKSCRLGGLGASKL